MTRQVRSAKTKQLFLNGQRVTVEEALSRGRVHSVVRDRYLTEATKEFAKQIADGPPVAQRFMKENINRALTADLRTCLGWEAERTVTTAGTADHKEAVAAFLEKRAPICRGE